MKAIYQFYVDCGRMGSLDGLFIADKSDIEKVMDKTVYFGEALGKHSEVEADITANTLTVKSEDQDFIKKVEEIFGTGTISGYNPLDYYNPDEE